MTPQTLVAHAVPTAKKKTERKRPRTGRETYRATAGGTCTTQRSAHKSSPPAPSSTAASSTTDSAPSLPSPSILSSANSRISGQTIPCSLAMLEGFPKTCSAGRIESWGCAYGGGCGKCGAPVFHLPTKKCIFPDFSNKSVTGSMFYLCIFLVRHTAILP